MARVPVALVHPVEALEVEQKVGLPSEAEALVPMSAGWPVQQRRTSLERCRRESDVSAVIEKTCFAFWVLAGG